MCSVLGPVSVLRSGSRPAETSRCVAIIGNWPSSRSCPAPPNAIVEQDAAMPYLGGAELLILLAVAGPILWALVDAVLASRFGWAVVLLLCLPAFPIGWVVAVYYLVA